MHSTRSTNSQSTAGVFAPLTIGPLQLRNRFIKSATNEGMTIDGVPSQMLVKHHADIAQGGAGMTTVAYCAVSQDGRTFENQIVMNAATRPHLRVLTDAVHRAGAAASAQLTHGGAFTFLNNLSTRYPRSASGGFNAAGVLSGRFFKRAMTHDEMSRVAAEFVRGALVAKEAGFDAVELHMGHGYLLSQFISPAYNRRTDAYGGHAAARARFPAEVLSRVLDAVGHQMAVVCKIGVTEGFKGGGTVNDAIDVAKTLEAAGAHLLVLSGGMNVECPWHIFGSTLPPEALSSINKPLMKFATRLSMLRQPSLEFEPLYFMQYSQQIRHAVHLPLAYLGGVKTLEAAQHAHEQGFDAIAMARAFIHDPAVVHQFAARLQSQAVTPETCSSCNHCVVSMYSAGGTSCVLRASDQIALNRLPAGALA